MVSVGFWQAPDVKPAASITNRFGDVVRLLELVQHRRLLVLAHARDAHLVDAAARDAVEARVRADVLRRPPPPCISARRLRHVGDHLASRSRPTPCGSSGPGCRTRRSRSCRSRRSSRSRAGTRRSRPGRTRRPGRAAPSCTPRRSRARRQLKPLAAAALEAVAAAGSACRCGPFFVLRKRIT